MGKWAERDSEELNVERVLSTHLQGALDFKSQRLKPTDITVRMSAPEAEAYVATITLSERAATPANQLKLVKALSQLTGTLEVKPEPKMSGAVDVKVNFSVDDLAGAIQNLPRK